MCVHIDIDSYSCVFSFRLELSMYVPVRIQVVILSCRVFTVVGGEWLREWVPNLAEGSPQRL